MRPAHSSAHALPLDDRLFQKPFYVTHAGWEKVAPRQTYPRPGHPSYYQFKWEDGRVLGEFLLSYVVSGKGELHTRQGRQSLRAGDAFLYQPGEWHRHRPLAASGWSIMWINFNGSLPHSWLEEGNFQLEKNLVCLADRKLFASQFRRLVESVDAADSRNSLQFSWQAIGLLSHFLADANAPAFNRTEKKSSGDPVVDLAMDFIWSQSHNRIGVADVARHAGVNRRTLERHFRMSSQSTPLGEIQRSRTARAALLLRETDVPVKYIIGRAGFTDYQGMRQAFQQQFKMGPKNYREKQRGAAAGKF
ncbi:MAG TPA: AraC family transcriptional regulator [Verrucomicrobiae bacterium]|jgi:AraC-like DNA-binding protein